MIDGITWAHLHVGDTVLGADARTWVIVERVAGLEWASGASDARFKLQLGERIVSITRALNDPAPVVAIADHRAMAAAVGEFYSVFPATRFVEETAVQPSQPAPAKTKVKHDQYNRYVLPHPETGHEQAWTRVSTVARTLADEYGLTRWKLRMVAKGIALRPDLLAGAAAADPEDDKSVLNDLAEQAMERAGSAAGANTGTALHSFTQRLDRGEPFASLGIPTQPLEADLRAYGETLSGAGLGVLPELMERVVILPELGIAGRIDRLVNLPPSNGKGPGASMSVLDLKTGKDLSYSWLEILIQQACYAHGSYMWNEYTNSYEPMPPVDQSRALVLHLPVGKARGQIYGLDIIKGWQYAQLALSVREARKAARQLAWLVEPDDPATVALHNVSRAESREVLASLWENLNRRGLWTQEVDTAAHARLAEIERQPVNA